MKFSRRLADVGLGRVFGVEGENGYTFFSATLDECWKFMQKNKHCHEVIPPTTPCHLYFDLDGGVAAVRDAVTWLKKHLLYIFNMKYGHTEIITLTSNSRKGSAHLIVKPHVFSNLSQCQLFVARLQMYLEQTGEFDEELWKTIDRGVYRPNKMMRMLGMTKRKESRPFIGKPFLKEFWIQTLIQPPTYKKVIDLGARSALCKGTPPKTFKRIEDWLRSKGEIMSVWSPPISNWLVSVSFRRYKCPYHGKVHKSNHNYVLVNLEKQKFQVRCQDPDCKGKWKLWKNLPPVLHSTRQEYYSEVLKSYNI